MEERLWHKLDRYACSGENIEGLFIISSRSAWFEGHFPGNPVLPGISMLGMVQELFRRYDPSKKVVRFKRITFREIVHADASLNITINKLQESADNVYSFDINYNGNLVCSGFLETAVGKGSA